VGGWNVGRSERRWARGEWSGVRCEKGVESVEQQQRQGFDVRFVFLTSKNQRIGRNHSITSKPFPLPHFLLQTLTSLLLPTPPHLHSPLL